MEINNKALVEVEEVLKKLSRYEYKKIPQEVIEYISKNKDTSYTWQYNENIPLNKQDLCDDAKEIISEIFMKYIVRTEDKIAMQKQLLKKEQKNIELNKLKMNDLSDVFKTRKHSNTYQEQEIIQINKKDNSLFNKMKKNLLKFFKNIFKKN